MTQNIFAKNNYNRIKCIRHLKNSFVTKNKCNNWIYGKQLRTRISYKSLCIFLKLLLLSLSLHYSDGLLIEQPNIVGFEETVNKEISGENTSYNTSNRINFKIPEIGSTTPNNVVTSISTATANGYLDKLDNLERSVAAVLIKVAYGTTSTTKRSIPDTSYISSLTTVATPLLTTLRYVEKTPHQKQQINGHHLNYEVDLERDHALPTSAPNADILKSNSNPTYPNPNRHHGHDRERHRHMYNSTPLPSLPNLLKKTNNQSPTVPMYPGDIPSYSPPSRSFFTPPLPPEYQNPFADKPTLRGTNNDGPMANNGAYVNRRPIPPPSLMPGHERIPFRPPDLAASTGNNPSLNNSSGVDSKKVTKTSAIEISEPQDRKKALNTPSRINDASETSKNKYHDHISGSNTNTNHEVVSINGNVELSSKGQEVLPSIRRILSGSNGKKGDIPDVLLKQVTTRPVSYHQLPSVPVVVIENSAHNQDAYDETIALGPNINKIKEPLSTEISVLNNEFKSQTKLRSSQKPDVLKDFHIPISSTPSAAAAIGEATSFTTLSSHPAITVSSSSKDLTSNAGAEATASVAQSTWTIAWNIHVYLSVILFTILAVYSFYKMVTYNKLTHLFSQSYFVCIHLILFIICATRVFYLCYDAYNIHSSFQIFVAELLLNLPSTFLTVSFSVLVLFLFLKSLNHKNNRYSALIRPLTVVVGCGVHVVLCITLHYVESYTLENQYLYYQQHQQQQYYRRQQQQYAAFSTLNLHVTLSPSTGSVSPPPPPRVLTLICQIIYIFVCLSLGVLYLYLYRILKRILRSKSQNYIHGYQNLSYAIHITIATALLFILLAALQIFGAISISTSRPLITQTTAEIDWLQWGYQFSLRLIEVAIITLISWVTGLKTSGGSSSIGNGDPRPNAGNSGNGIFGTVQHTGSGTATNREKHMGNSHQQHANVSNFFLPCTSSSSQEHFETDYPAICNTNTNLHTYTMRTGKLIYDDSYALNAIGPGIQNNCGQTVGEYQQQPTYQRPYDSGTITEFGSQGVQSNPRYHHPTSATGEQNHYTDYLTDATTDHYENPNFDLQGSNSVAESVNAIPKLNKTSTSSTTVISSGGSGTSAASQQQILLLQSDSCYSEPLQEHESSYEFNNFERPMYVAENDSITNNIQKIDGGECWIEKRISINPARDKKCHANYNLERGSYDNPERRSSNSTNSCTSSSGGGVGSNRYACYNTFDRAYYNSGVRKSGTLNNIVNNSHSSHHHRVIASNNISGINNIAVQRPQGVQTLGLTERQHCPQRNGRSNNKSRVAVKTQDLVFVRPNNMSQTVQNKRNLNHKMANHNQTDDDEDDIDDIAIDSNVECTNLIHNNKDGSFINTNATGVGIHSTEQDLSTFCSIVPSKNQHHNSNIKHSSQPHIQAPNVQTNLIVASQSRQHLQQSNQLQNYSTKPENITSPATSTNSSTTTSTADESMLVTEQGFLRFRAVDDINNAQGIGIHNASIRNHSRGTNANIGVNGSSHVACSSDNTTNSEKDIKLK